MVTNLKPEVQNLFRCEVNLLYNTFKLIKFIISYTLNHKDFLSTKSKHQRVSLKRFLFYLKLNVSSDYKKLWRTLLRLQSERQIDVNFVQIVHIRVLKSKFGKSVQ